MYFTRPQQLLDIFAGLEERNLFLIQNSQETEEQLEELKQKLEVTQTKMEKEKVDLNSQIDALVDNIKAEEAKAAALRERANPLKGQVVPPFLTPRCKRGSSTGHFIGVA